MTSSLDFLLHPTPRPVLQRLGQVLGPDLRLAGQVGDRARQLEHAVIGARAQLQLPHRRAHEILACCVDRAELLHLGRAHVAVDEHVGLAQLGEAFVLDLARRFHPARGSLWTARRPPVRPAFRRARAARPGGCRCGP